MSKAPTREQVNIEFKTMPTFTKAVTDRTVIGITAVMGNIDDGGDCGHLGMFAKTVGSGIGRVKHLWQHDAWQPPIAVVKSLREIGRADLPQELLSQFPNAEGALEVEREYLDTPRADEIFKGIKAGAINEMSYGYDTIKCDFEERNDGTFKGMVRHLREVRLWDTSDVNWGMNPATVAAKHGLPSYLVDLTTLSRDWLNRAEALKAGRVLSSANLERLQTAIDMLNEVWQSAEPPDDEAADDAVKSDPALTERIRQQLEIAELELKLYE
jgi:HK97 family phage prohead protease